MSHHSDSYVNEKLTNNEGDEPKLEGLNKQELRIKKNKHGTKTIFTRRTYLNLSLIIIQISQSAVQMLNNGIKHFTRMEREIYCTLF
jgi:hypothetical protein